MLLSMILALALGAMAPAAAFPATDQPASYTNPVLYADYSDPDVIRVGDDYWMTASSFNCAPGLQILHSSDLVNWEIVGSALPQGPAAYWGDRLPNAKLLVQHGNGVWAPSIRYHDGKYWIFWGDPDFGIYQVNTTDPAGKWSDPVCVIEGRGYIDPCPLWDDDGRVWLVHAWAFSRCGIKSILSLCELNADCTARISPEDDKMIFDGRENGQETIEGPKFYKKDGKYYIFAPAGGVKTGWQLVLRSDKVDGPYEYRRVLEKGGTLICGPHQGAWVSDVDGKDWFLHFEDRYAWGRVCHLQPMQWQPDGWCTMGSAALPTGAEVSSAPVVCGKPVTGCQMPAAGKKPRKFKTDWFVSEGWQWHGAPQDDWLSLKGRTMRLKCVCPLGDGSRLWDSEALLLRKIQGPQDEFTVKLTLHPEDSGDQAGIVVMGTDYASLSVFYDGFTTSVDYRTCFSADKERTPVTVSSHYVKGPVWLRVTVEEGVIRSKSTSDIQALCRFYYSTDGKSFTAIGSPFTATAGKWIGAKLGVFAQSDTESSTAFAEISR